MKKTILSFFLVLASLAGWGQTIQICSPDEALKVDFTLKDGIPVYAVTYDGRQMLEDSPLGFVADMGDFSREMTLAKQETRRIDRTYTQDRIKRLYESILSDADDHGLMVIFHGCTLPRGWERMYPNYVGSEAVLASENLVFDQHYDDMEAFNACLHPFIRNTVGCMEFGGSFLNKRYNRTNDGGQIRRTTDVFQLATAILFQNPIQNFALTPNNLTDAPQVALDFMRQVPTTWDETVFIDGYPGKYVVLARRHGFQWYIVGINAQKEPLKLDVKLPMFREGQSLWTYTDGKQGEPVFSEVMVKKSGVQSVVIQPNGGVILMNRP